MGIVPALSARRLQAGTEHRVVHVDGQGAGVKPPHATGGHVGVEPFQGRLPGGREALEKTTDAVMRRQFLQRAESVHQGIAPQEVQVTKATAAHKDQAQDRLAHARRTVIAARHLFTRLSSPSDHAQIPYHQFQSAVGGQAFGSEIDRQIGVDAGA